MNIEEILELLRSTQINFDNLITTNPQIEGHPMYKIAKMQLDECVDRLESLSQQPTQEGK